MPAQRVIHNPIVPGFYPDPSVCRVGDAFYLVTSSFEYFPGVPIFRSEDLVRWQQIGHVLTRESQLDLRVSQSSAGIFAPTIRHHDGVFYVITTNMTAGGNFYVTATDAAGPWSEPVWIDPEGMDPSLLFDDDGRVYYTRHGEGRHGGIYQAELDLEGRKLRGEPQRIWGGTGDIWPEGPHLYKIGAHYYLLIAEGGTHLEHMATIARAESPYGPFEANPANPILTHRHLRHEPIQALGHSELFDDAAGNWWMTFLGIRQTPDEVHHLGRETFLAPVEWRDGWPVINSGQSIPLRLSTDRLPAPSGAAVAHPSEESQSSADEGNGCTAPKRDNFEATSLPHHYCHVRNPDPTAYSLTERPGFLRLHGRAAHLESVSQPTFAGRRQQHFDVQASTTLEFPASHAEQHAGLVLRANEDNHYAVLICGGNPRRVVLRARISGQTTVLAEHPIEDGRVCLSVKADAVQYSFECSAAGGWRTQLGRCPTRSLSSEVAGGFTGVIFGLYAHTAGAPCHADFEYFEMLPT